MLNKTMIRILLLTLLALAFAHPALADPEPDSKHAFDGTATLVVDGEVEALRVVQTNVHDVSGPGASALEQVFLDVAFERFVNPHTGQALTARIRLQCFPDDVSSLGPCEGLTRGDRVRVWADLLSIEDWFSPTTVSSPPTVVLVEHP